ncbi:MAG: DNA polymerase III subunit gamma/tau [Neisseriaceae bacterium]|nr:DNA polymerase III subunit gamma/tau [Neisseriaceae bacterium]
MSYQALARKWRPKTFATLVGQEHVIRALQNALTAERLHHAYLLTGTRGVGKTTIARILAKSLNCETPHANEPCGECDACVQIDTGRYVDVFEIDAASNTGIDNIREILENAQYAPTQGKYKVYIIDEVHMLSKSAFNAMLKTLEEPPAHVKFILATTDPQKVPITVLSRCLQFSLRNMTPAQITQHLQHVLTVENLPFELTALNLLSRAASGSMRDALSLLDQAIAYSLGEVKKEGVRTMLGAVDRNYLFQLLDWIAQKNGQGLMQEVTQLALRGIDFDSALTELAQVLQTLALAQLAPQALDMQDPEYATFMALAPRFSPEDIQLYYQIALMAKKDLAFAPDEQAGFTMAMLRMLAFAPATVEQTAHHAANLTAASPERLPPVSQTPPQTILSSLASELLAQTESNAVALPIVTEPDSPAPQKKKPSCDQEWLALIAELMPKMGIARMLAANAFFQKFDQQNLHLGLAQTYKAMEDRQFQTALSEVLSHHFQEPIHIHIHLENTQADNTLPQETHAAQEKRLHEAALESAQTAFMGDTNVQNWITQFDGKIEPKSISAFLKAN